MFTIFIMLGLFDPAAESSPEGSFGFGSDMFGVRIELVYAKM